MTIFSMKRNVYDLTSFLYRALLFIVLIVSMNLPCQVSYGLENLLIRSQQNQDHGRLILQFLEPNDFSTQRTNGELIFSFSRPFYLSEAQNSHLIPDYISDIILENHNRLKIKLTHPSIKFHALKSKSFIIIDLFKTQKVSSLNLPSKLPIDLSLSDQEDAIKSIRFGQHQSYHRLVLDFHDNVKYDFKKQSNKVIITLLSPHQFSSSWIKNHIPPKNKLSYFVANKKHLHFSPPRGKNIRVSQWKNKLILDQVSDFLIKGLPSSSKFLKAKPPTTSQEPPPSFIKKTPKPTNPQEKAQVKIPPANSKKKHSPPLLNQPAKGVSSLLIQNKITIRKLNKDQFILFSPFDQESGLNIWSHGNDTWIISNQKKKVKIPKELIAQHQSILENIEYIDHPHASILKIKTKRTYEIITQASKNKWLIYFKNNAFKHPKTKYMMTLSKTSEPLFFIEMNHSNSLIKLPLASRGQTLWLIPTTSPQEFIEKRVSFPHFTLEPTAQGIIVLPHSPLLKINLQKNNQITLYSKKTNISQDMITYIKNRQRVHKENALNSKYLYDFKKWSQYLSPTNQSKNIDYYRPGAGKKHINQSRLDLARYYISQGMAHEAQEILLLINENDFLLKEKPFFKSLQAAIYSLKNQPSQALKTLKDVPEKLDKKLWRAFNIAQSAKNLDTSKDLNASIQILSTYPDYIFFTLIGPLIENSIKNNHINLANQLIQIAEKRNPIQIHIDQITYFKALLYKKRKAYLQAENNFKKIKNSTSRRIRAHGRYENILMKINNQSASIKEALEELKKIRYTWREKSFEFKILNILAELYEKNKEYRNALKSYQEAAIINQDPEFSRPVVAKMEKLFKELYIHKKANDMPSFSAIALYNEFRELTPSNKDGQRIIQNLINRLIKIELLDQACEVLDHYLSYRLQKPEDRKKRAQFTLQLIYLHIRNQKPKIALEILKKSEKNPFSQNFSLQRKHLEAKSYILLKKYKKALEILDQDLSKQAHLMKINIFHEMKNWFAKAKTIRSLIGKPEYFLKDFSEEKAFLILNLASTLALSGENKQLQRLKFRMTDLMDKSKFKDIFRLITAETPAAMPPDINLQQEVKRVENFQSFMKNYRQQMEALIPNSSDDHTIKDSNQSLNDQKTKT